MDGAENSPDTRPVCNLPPLPEGQCYPLRAIAAAKDCRLPLKEGFCFAADQRVYDKHGHELDGDFDPAGHHGCNHRATPEWKAEHPRKHVKKEKKVMSEHKEAPHEEAPPAPALAVPAMPAVPKPEELVATVGVDQAITQVKGLVPAGASPSLMIGGAALFAILGAAVKFGPGLLKARAESLAKEKELAHEEKMKQLELEEKKVEKQDEQHGQCNAARMALEARVAASEQKSSALEAKLAEVEAKAAAAEKAAAEKPASEMPELDFDPEAFEARIKKLEAALKPAPKKRK